MTLLSIKACRPLGLFPTCQGLPLSNQTNTGGHKYHSTCLPGPSRFQPKAHYHCVPSSHTLQTFFSHPLASQNVNR